MKKEKEISFNDYLQEDVLAVNNIPEQVLEIIQKHDLTPELIEQELPASEVEMKEYWKKLRHFFRTGEKISETKTKIYPALLAPYFKGQTPETDFPYFLENEKIIPLRQLLQNTFSALFTGKEAKILNENLKRIEDYIKSEIKDTKEPVDFYTTARKCFNKIKELDIRGDEGKIFKEQVDKLFNGLPTEGTLINFSELTPFYLLSQQLEYFHVKRINFLLNIRKVISSLKELLSVENEKEENGDAQKLGKDFLFADTMISFDKVVDFIPESASEKMSPKRLERIKSTLENLKNAEQFLDNVNSVIFLNEEVENLYSVKKLLLNSNVHVFNSNGCKKAYHKFENEIKSFTDIIAAFRIADLELKDKYDDLVHDDYFKLFDWRQLNDEELSLYPSLILIHKTNDLLANELTDYSKIISSNIPVKFLIVNTGEETAEVFRQELSALTIAQRGAFVFQGGNDNLMLLGNAINEGLKSSVPVLWHVLNINEFLSTSAAIESREFPRIYYNYKSGEQSGSRFDIGINPQPEKLWPMYSLEVKHGKEKQQLEVSFTLADRKILNENSALELELIPEKYHTGDLVLLSEYLISNNNELIGKIPFISVVDENNKVRKAVVPFSWLPGCKERSDFWQYIQEAGGVNSFHVNKALENAREVWNNEKQIEINRLENNFKVEIEKVSNEAAGNAMDKLVSVLLDLDNVVTTPVIKPAEKKITVTENANGNAVKEEKVEDKVEEITLSSEPWVESFKCTSCNDCTDKLPNVFKYNSDKQAYIYDVTKASFRQLVEVAEKCPAKCIHTGEPADPNEPGLVDLVKRAEPFK